MPQTHANGLALPGDDSERSGHATHGACPACSLYFPGIHNEQSTPSGLVAPALQEQDAFPPCENEFRTQRVHAPPSGPVHPALHVQRASPSASLSAPSPHGSHGPPSGPVAPALQVQAVKRELPSREFDLIGHAKHVEVPDAILYFPASHCVHGPPSEPVAPALQKQVVCPPSENEFTVQSVHTPPSLPVEPLLHTQSVTASLATGEFEFAGHDKQEDLSIDEYDPVWQSIQGSSIAPTVAENLPAAQLVHAALPGAFLYVPATQGVHVRPSGPKTVEPALHVQSMAAPLATGEFEFAAHGAHCRHSCDVLTGGLIDTVLLYSEFAIL